MFILLVRWNQEGILASSRVAGLIVRATGRGGFFLNTCIDVATIRLMANTNSMQMLVIIKANPFGSLWLTLARSWAASTASFARADWLSCEAVSSSNENSRNARVCCKNMSKSPVGKAQILTLKNYPDL